MTKNHFSWPKAAAALAIALCFYVALYLSLCVPTPGILETKLGTALPMTGYATVIIPTYRAGGSASKYFFWPLQKLDERFFPNRWEPVPQTLTFDSAVKLLSTTMTSRYAIVAINSAALLKLFQDQFQAISVIHSSHKNVDLSILLPFLDANEDNKVGIWDTESTDIGYLRTKWPVFSLIIDMPGAPQSLEKYALDKKHPLEYRLDALEILDFVDQDGFKSVANQMKNEFTTIDLPNTRHFVITMVTDWQDGKDAFDGGIEIPPYVQIENLEHPSKAIISDVEKQRRGLGWR